MSERRECIACGRAGHLSDACPRKLWRFPVVLAAVLLAGCSTVTGVRDHVLEQAQPTIVRDGEGRAWIWMRGMVPTVVMRLKEADKVSP